MPDKDRFMGLAERLQRLGHAEVRACQVVDRRRATMRLDMGDQLFAGRAGAVVRGHPFLDLKVRELAAQHASKPHFAFLL